MYPPTQSHHLTTNAGGQRGTSTRPGFAEPQTPEKSDEIRRAGRHGFVWPRRGWDAGGGGALGGRQPANKSAPMEL
jgi:hypothetical protein